MRTSCRFIWNAGEGIGAVKAVMTSAEFVDRVKRECKAAKARVTA